MVWGLVQPIHQFQLLPHENGEDVQSLASLRTALGCAK